MLNGKSVLVLEEEFLIALDIQRVLETLGAGQALFARTLQEAQSIDVEEVNIGLAILEVRLDPAPSLALADTLLKNGIPVVLSAAEMSFSRGLTHLPGVPVVTKPMVESDLVAAISRAMLARPQQTLE